MLRQHGGPACCVRNPGMSGRCSGEAWRLHPTGTRQRALQERNDRSMGRMSLTCGLVSHVLGIAHPNIQGQQVLGIGHLLHEAGHCFRPAALPKEVQGSECTTIVAHSPSHTIHGVQLQGVVLWTHIPTLTLKDRWGGCRWGKVKGREEEGQGTELSSSGTPALHSCSASPPMRDHTPSPWSICQEIRLHEGQLARRATPGRVLWSVGKRQKNTNPVSSRDVKCS